MFCYLLMIFAIAVLNFGDGFELYKCCLCIDLSWFAILSFIMKIIIMMFVFMAYLTSCGMQFKTYKEA